jgi:predicted O-methyltransferase YrrM
MADRFSDAKFALKAGLARLFARGLPAGFWTDRRLFGIWEERGVHMTPVHFYQPIPDTRTLRDGAFDRPSETVGVALNEPAQLACLDDYVARFRGEYEEETRQAPEPWSFRADNGAFESPDAEVLYYMIRAHRPQRVIEIGSGSSTLLTATALRRNARAGGPEANFTAIEPYPNAILKAGVPGLTALLECPLQDVPLARFQELQANDVLFIDSSHVLAIGSDVQYEYLEILPRLNPGILVHIHDIFLPYEYPKEWVLDRHLFWNEQYLLQAFLTFNDRYEVLWAGSYVHRRHPEKLREAIPASQGHLPGSFWIRRVG